MGKSPYYDTAQIEKAFEEACLGTLQITHRLELRRLVTSLWYDTEMKKQGVTDHTWDREKEMPDLKLK